MAAVAELVIVRDEVKGPGVVLVKANGEPVTAAVTPVDVEVGGVTETDKV